jgi:hypothetical protein
MIKVFAAIMGSSWVGFDYSTGARVQTSAMQQFEHSITVARRGRAASVCSRANALKQLIL